MQRLASCFALAGLLLTAACGSGSNGTTDPGGGGGGGGGGGTLTVGVAQSGGSTTAGGQVTVGVSIVRGGSFSGTVSLAVEGAPSGVSTSLSSTSLPASVTSATLTVSTTTAVAAGSYPLTIRATGSGVSAATATYTLTVTAPQTPDFALAATPGALSVQAGQNGTVAVAITRSGGFTGSVTFTATGAPTGTNVSFAPASTTTGATTATIAVGASTTPGTYDLTLSGSGDGVGARTTVVSLTVTAPPSIGLVSANTAVSITQGQQSAALPIIITRGGGTGDVTFTSNAPAGITATFTPNPATGPSTQLVFAVGTGVAPGPYTIRVTGTAGGVSGTLDFTVTVTAAAAGDFAMSAVPSSGTVTAGQTALTTINIARSGGFTGVVNLTATGLPAGATVQFTPAAAAGTQSQLGIVTSASTPAGSYTITIRGNATLLAERTVTYQLTVQAGGGGSGNIAWQFCNLSDLPFFFAVQDGPSGAWTRVTPDGTNTYRFSLTSDVGGVAIVRPQEGGVAEGLVYYFRRDELVDLGLAECISNPAGKTLTGTVAGLSLLVNADIAVGAARTAVNGPGTTFTLQNVSGGTQDLLAFRAALDIGTQSSIPDRVIMRRDVNYAPGSAIPLLDFNSGEAFAPATATYTFSNTNGESFIATTQFVSSNGTGGSFVYGLLGGNTSATKTVYGIPSGRLRNGDFHQVFATTISNPNDIRIVFQYNRELIDRTIAFGPSLEVPSVSSLGNTPYVRLRATGAWQSNYGLSAGISFQQNGGGGRVWGVTVSRGYAAGGSYTLDIPDLSSVSGWNPTWALVSGQEVTWAISATGATVGVPGVAAEGTRYEVATRRGSITP